MFAISSAFETRARLRRAEDEIQPPASYEERNSRCPLTRSNMTHRPPNVPQRHANQASHARYAAHARTFFLSDFVSIENKGSKILIPKLKVASSSLVARSKFTQQDRKGLRVVSVSSPKTFPRFVGSQPSASRELILTTDLQRFLWWLTSIP